MINCVKKNIGLVTAFILALTNLFAFGSTASAESYAGYIMGYFKDGTGQYGLNLCYSTDGLNWTNLNHGNPYYVPIMGQKGLRDPFLFRKQDGTFAVVATDMRGQSWGDHSQYIHYFESKDLRTFSNERLLKVHNTEMHAWAPEVFYDSANKRYGIYWSGNTDYNRTYVNYTTDFNTLTTNQVLFDPGYDVIDSDIITNGSTNYLLFKDERSSGKRIKAAKSSSLNPGSFSVFTSNFITSANTEGPITFKDNKSNAWYMYADLFSQSGIFECWKTTDLDATSWTKVTNISVPSGVRHGSIVPVTKNELDIARGVSQANTPTITQPPVKYGDVSGDGGVDSADFTTMRRFLLGIINTMPSSNWKIAGDLNLDATIDSADYTILRKYLLGLIPSIPVGMASVTPAPPVALPATNKTIRLQLSTDKSFYLRHWDFAAKFEPNPSPVADSQFIERPGLADSGCISFESVNYPGYYLRHYNYVLRVEKSDNTQVFQKDATFKKMTGLGNSSGVSYQSYNYPDMYIQSFNYICEISEVTNDLDKSNATFILSVENN